jgi:hypothetical protein
MRFLIHYFHSTTTTTTMQIPEYLDDGCRLQYKVPEFFTRSSSIADDANLDEPGWDLCTVYDVMRKTQDEELVKLYKDIKIEGGNNQFEFLFEYLMESRFPRLVKMCIGGVHRNLGNPTLTFDNLPILKKD